MTRHAICADSQRWTMEARAPVSKYKLFTSASAARLSPIRTSVAFDPVHRVVWRFFGTRACLVWHRSAGGFENVPAPSRSEMCSIGQFWCCFRLCSMLVTCKIESVWKFCTIFDVLCLMNIELFRFWWKISYIIFGLERYVVWIQEIFSNKVWKGGSTSSGVDYDPTPHYLVQSKPCRLWKDAEERRDRERSHVDASGRRKSAWKAPPGARSFGEAGAEK